MAELPALPGVKFEPLVEAGETAALRRLAVELIREGVRFRSQVAAVPWLVAARPFAVDRDLRRQLELLGRAVFAHFDALQALYGDGDPVVRAGLDGLTPGWLCGIETERPLEMFRLDVVLAGGRPWITEVEETFGSVGKTLAMERAYGLEEGGFVDHLMNRAVGGVVVCDDYPEYLPELEIVSRRVAERNGRPMPVELISRLREPPRGVVWRFAGVGELARYGPSLPPTLSGGEAEFVNPLFHGYGTKAALALVHQPLLAERLEALAGPDAARLRGAVPRSIVLPRAGGAGRLDADRRRLLLKVAECPALPQLTWGSRGVRFGERSRGEWEEALGEAEAGYVRVPSGERHPARHVLSELIDSDRFDVDFLHPGGGAVCRMGRARCRLGPIFTRNGRDVSLTGGHATFVNTSRKVHLGRHAVCAPLDLSGDPLRR